MNGQENTQQYPINKECDSVMLVTWQTLGYKLHSNGSMANKKNEPKPTFVTEDFTAYTVHDAFH